MRKMKKISAAILALTFVFSLISSSMLFVDAAAISKDQVDWSHWNNIGPLATKPTDATKYVSFQYTQVPSDAAKKAGGAGYTVKPLPDKINPKNIHAGDHFWYVLGLENYDGAHTIQLNAHYVWDQTKVQLYASYSGKNANVTYNYTALKNTANATDTLENGQSYNLVRLPIYAIQGQEDYSTLDTSALVGTLAKGTAGYPDSETDSPWHSLYLSVQTQGSGYAIDDDGKYLYAIEFVAIADGDPGIHVAPMLAKDYSGKPTQWECYGVDYEDYNAAAPYGINIMVQSAGETEPSAARWYYDYKTDDMTDAEYKTLQSNDPVFDKLYGDGAGGGEDPDPSTEPSTGPTTPPDPGTVETPKPGPGAGENPFDPVPTPAGGEVTKPVAGSVNGYLRLEKNILLDPANRPKVTLYQATNPDTPIVANNALTGTAGTNYNEVGNAFTFGDGYFCVKSTGTAADNAAYALKIEYPGYLTRVISIKGNLTNGCLVAHKSTGIVLLAGMIHGDQAAQTSSTVITADDLTNLRNKYNTYDAEHHGKEPNESKNPYDRMYDFNKDYAINVTDLSMLLSNFGKQVSDGYSAWETTIN